MASTGRSCLAAGCQSLHPEFADRFQHHEACLIVTSCYLPHQAALDELRQAFEHGNRSVGNRETGVGSRTQLLPTPVSRLPTDVLRRLQGETAGEDGESAKQALLARA